MQMPVSGLLLCLCEAAWKEMFMAWLAFALVKAGLKNKEARNAAANRLSGLCRGG